MTGQMAIARALTGFNDLGRSVTPMFLSIDHFLYSEIFYVRGKNEKNLSTRSLNFWQNAPSNSVLSSSSCICAAVSNAS